MRSPSPFACRCDCHYEPEDFPAERNPSKTIDEYLDALGAQGLMQIASVLREYMF
jgi:hypothetical protein